VISLLPYVTNDVGDIYRRRDGGTVEPFQPDKFGWSGWRARPENRRSLDQIATLPGFKVTDETGPQFVPGPRPRRSQWLEWKDGAAPPAAAESKAGPVYFDRLTDALGRVADRLPGNPGRSPFVVYDFVDGRRFTIEYQPPELEPGGPGTVYVLDDGHAFKIGHTNDYVAVRVKNMQTGNPRVIRTVAEVSSASPAVEKHLQGAFAQWNLRCEWFKRAPLKKLAADSGGWKELLRRQLPPPPPGGDWDIIIVEADS
jgi:hypothetical protein